jgi:hypothetical protein
MFTIAPGNPVAGAVATSGRSAVANLTMFRTRFHALCWRRADALFELTDAMLCAQGPVRSPVELSLEPEFRRGHGSVYDALAGGGIDAGALRRLLLGLSCPARPGQPLMFAIDVTPQARPDAEYADERVMVQIRGKGGDKFLPGWPTACWSGCSGARRRGWWIPSRPGVSASCSRRSRIRGSRCSSAARNARSVVVSRGLSIWRCRNGELMPQGQDFDVLVPVAHRQQA